MDDGSARTAPHPTAAFRPWALIAAKRFGRAKARLSAALPPHERRTLASAMFERVLDACAQSTALHGTLVATDGDDVAALARGRAAGVVRDGATSVLSRIIDIGLEDLRARGATHALIVMADLPLLETRDVAELLARMRAYDVVVTPDLQRRGTNALGVRLAAGITTCFGHDDSLQRHLQQAARMSARVAVLYHPRIALDIDEPPDLMRWRERAHARSSGFVVDAYTQ